MTQTKRGLPLHWLMLIGFVVGLSGGLLVNLISGKTLARQTASNRPDSNR